MSLNNAGLFAARGSRGRQAEHDREYRGDRTFTVAQHSLWLLASFVPPRRQFLGGLRWHIACRGHAAGVGDVCDLCSRMSVEQENDLVNDWRRCDPLLPSAQEQRQLQRLARTALEEEVQDDLLVPI